ncbi:MAG TPA: BON domain-containing protein, partial [Gemmataceae bacterium]
MQKFHAMLIVGGCTVLGLSILATPLRAQGLGSGSSMSSPGGSTGSSGLGSSGASSSGGASSGATLGGSNFLQSPTSFLSSTGTNTTTGANRNTAGNRTTGSSTSATGTGSAYQGIAASNLLGSYYANPLAAGLPAGTTQPRFGAPLYNITAANLSTTGTGALGGQNRGGTATTSSSAYAGTSTAGVRRAPTYTTTIGFDYRPPSAGSMQSALQQTIAESSSLPSRSGMTVAVDGDTVVLRGTVGSERERRMAEGLVRLTPGVHEVQN